MSHNHQLKNDGMSLYKTHKKVDKGHVLEVGDWILTRSAFGGRNHEVIRVTKKYAFVKYNAIAEGRFPRIYDMRFEVLPRAQYNMTDYQVLTPVNPTNNPDRNNA